MKASWEERGEAERADGETTRSRPPEEVSYFLPWMVFLMVLAAAVAWFVPVKTLVEQRLWAAEDSGPRTASSFVALAYRGVSDRPEEISPAVFREHVAALRRAGYKPITLRDVRALYRDGRLLPERAVLLTFEHGRRSTYFNVKRPLQRAGWTAVMFLWVRAIDEQDPASLRWPYVRNLVRSRNWEIAAQSYDGFRRVPAGASGKVGNPLTTPRWVEAERRHETPEEFQDRLRADHETAIDRIERRTGVRPEAFAYPFGDFGQYHSRAVRIPALNLALVERYYDVAFLLGNLALNTQQSDPRRLNRLLVRPGWSGEDLVHMLDRTWPGANVGEGADPAKLSWIVDWGGFESDEAGGLRLYAVPETTGAKAWLAGSDLARDLHARFTFRIDRGQIGLHLRASPDGEAYLYLGIEPGTADGEDRAGGGFWLRQKDVEGGRQTLAHAPVPVEAGRAYTVDVFLRDRLCFVLVDGDSLFPDGVFLRTAAIPGMVGVSVWAPEFGLASARVERAEVRPSPRAVAAWTPTDAGDRSAVDWIHRQAYRLSDISPGWIRSGASSFAVRDAGDAELYRALARLHGLRWMPRFVVEHEGGLHRAAPSRIAEHVQDVGADGVFLDLSGLAAASLPRLAAWLQQCGDLLAERGLEVLLQLPRTRDGGARMRPLLAVLPHGQLVVDPGEPEPAPPGAVPRHDVPEDEDLPLAYMIPTLPGGRVEETARGRAGRLHQEGLGAFSEGDFERAERLWAEWVELEPEHPHALMLLGDVRVRLGSHEEALEAYRRSLEIDPRQVSLAVRRAQLLDSLGRHEDALRQLNLYARLFPERDAVRLAQAEWLLRHNRYAEAQDLARVAARRHPGHLEALALWLRLADTEDDRRDALAGMLHAGALPENRVRFAQALERHDLLSLPGTRPLLQLVMRLAASDETPETAALFAAYVPRTRRTVETFEAGRISESWRVEGGGLGGLSGHMLLEVGPRFTEASVWLEGSRLTQDGFVECVVDSIEGSIWLFARRSSDALVRFGIAEGRLHLQAWRQGRMVSSVSQPWRRPPGSVRLALDVVGRGAAGYVNGRPAFDAPIHVPRSIGRGWLGLAVHDPDPGTAKAGVRALAAGPSPVQLALVDSPGSEAATEATIARIRSWTLGLSAICPSGYQMDNDGNLQRPPGEALDLWRLFAHYHHAWLLPAVRVPANAPVDPVLLQEAIRDGRTDGFLLLYDTAPGDREREVLRTFFESSDEILLTAVSGERADSLRIHGVGGGFDLLGHRDDDIVLPVREPGDADVRTPGARSPVVFRF